VTRVLRTAPVLVLTILLLALFARGVDFADVGRQIVDADLPPLLLALIASSSAYVLRAWRWQFLLRAVGPTRFTSAFRATAIGFAASFLLPGRTGEALRPYLLARRDGVSVVAAFATIVVERLLDLLAVLILFAGVLVAAPPAPRNDVFLMTALRTGGLWAGAIALAGFSVLVLVARYPQIAERIVTGATRLPARAGAAIASISGTFIAGVMVLRRPWHAALALAGAFPLWGCTALSIWAVSRAFHLGVPPSGAFVLLILLAVGVSIPTPGGVGTVHYLFRLGATTLYAASDARAAGAAIVFHAFTVVPISVAGVWLAAAQGMSLGRLRTLASKPPTAAAAAAIGVERERPTGIHPALR
jgi:uncharacterized protein (TIRG00374 family)